MKKDAAKDMKSDSAVKDAAAKDAAAKDAAAKDPVIDRVRAARHDISAQLDHDPDRLTTYYIELQQRYRDRLIAVDGPPASPPTEQPGAQS